MTSAFRMADMKKRGHVWLGHGARACGADGRLECVGASVGMERDGGCEPRESRAQVKAQSGSEVRPAPHDFVWRYAGCHDAV